MKKLCNGLRVVSLISNENMIYILYSDGEWVDEITPSG